MIKYILFIFFLVGNLTGFPQPQPDDVFREFIWTTPDHEKSEKFLRVGGRFDYRNEPEKFPPGYILDGYLTLPNQIDLEDAIRAEVQVEKDLCHEGTRGLSIKINDGTWYRFPESDSIPYPAFNYLHHTYPAIQIPLGSLNKQNVMFQFRVDSVQEWNWPQNLLYSVIFRVYYDRRKLTVTPSLTQPENGALLGEKVKISLDNTIRSQVRSVIFIGKYLDVNYEGDGIYTQWHYSYYRGERRNYLGKVTTLPFQVDWDTEWVPDQPHPFEIAALVRFENDLFYFTDPVKELKMDRRNVKTVLCKPMDQPEKWTTRAGEFTMHFNLEEDPENIECYQLVWASWSPCYANGIYINDHLVYIREGPCYDFKFHRVILEDLKPLNMGLNVIKTGQTPHDRDGNMVHGMDVQWPGFMVLVKLKK
jgi:hypothetical protein